MKTKFCAFQNQTEFSNDIWKLSKNIFLLFGFERLIRKEHLQQEH